MFVCCLISTIYSLNFSVSVCSLELGVTFKACLVIPDLFIRRLCPFCISLSKPAIVGLMGTGRPALFEKLQTCWISKCYKWYHKTDITAVYLIHCASEGKEWPFADSVCRKIFFFLIQDSQVNLSQAQETISFEYQDCLFYKLQAEHFKYHFHS